MVRVNRLFDSFIHNCLLQRRKLPQEMAWTLVSTRIVVQIQLMILLSIPPLPSRKDLSDNTALPPLLVRLLRHFFCNRLLLIAVIEYATSILRANIWALSVGSGRVVHAIEVFEQFAVGDLLRIEHELTSFCICGITMSAMHCKPDELVIRTSSPSRAYSTIARILRITSNVSYPRIVETFILEVFPVHMLHAPKTTCGDCGFLCALW
jgi:hypothetical protein